MSQTTKKRLAVANSYRVGDLVEAVPTYDLGNRSAGPSLDYPFEGMGVIVDLKWPAEARILINTGEVICIQLDKIQITTVKNQK